MRTHWRWGREEGGRASWCLSSFVRRGVVSRGLGSTPPSTRRRVRLPPLRREPAPAISRGHLSCRVFSRAQDHEGFPLTPRSERSGWRRRRRRRGRRTDTRHVGQEHLCAQRRCVSPKHVYSDLIYRSAGESGWLVYKEAGGGEKKSLVSRAGPGATSLRQMGPSCPLWRIMKVIFKGLEKRSIWKPAKPLF